MNLDRVVGRRGLLLTAFLLYVALSNAWGVYRSLDIYLDLVSHHDPNAPHWPFLLLGILSGCAVIGVLGLWRLKKWGLFLYLACWASALGIGIFVGVPFRGHLLSLANVVLLCLFLAPKRDLLRYEREVLDDPGRETLETDSRS